MSLKADVVQVDEITFHFYNVCQQILKTEIVEQRGTEITDYWKYNTEYRNQRIEQDSSMGIDTEGNIPNKEPIKDIVKIILPPIWRQAIEAPLYEKSFQQGLVIRTIDKDVELIGEERNVLKLILTIARDFKLAQSCEPQEGWDYYVKSRYLG